MNLAYPAFAVLGLIWGTNFLMMKWASLLITPLQIVFLRVLFGFVAILVFALLRRDLHWRQARQIHHFLVMSLLATSVYYFAFAKGASLLASGVAGMLSGAIPLFSFVCAALFLDSERPRPRKIAGVALGFAGVLLIARPWHSAANGVNPLGVLFMLAGSASVGASFVYTRRFLSAHAFSPFALATWQMGLALVTLAAVTDFHGIARIATDRATFAGMVFGLGLAGTGIAFVLYYFIVHRLGAVAASSVTYLPPVVALAIGCVFAGEPLHPWDLGALVLILSGVYLLQAPRGKLNARDSRARAV